jgi:hypothetical protein
MRTKILVVFRSKSVGVQDEKMNLVYVLMPETVWESSVVTEEQIQALATHGLLRPKVEVGWRPAAGGSSLPRGPARPSSSSCTSSVGSGS